MVRGECEVPRWGGVRRRRVRWKGNGGEGAFIGGGGPGRRGDAAVDDEGTARGSVGGQWTEGHGG